jgi:cytochrome c-type biogenesis protein
VAGLAFGFGWTPCIGPVLTSILAIAATADQAITGAALLAAYSLGLGLPFLITGLLLGRLSRQFDWVKAHLQQIVLGSAIMLAAMGVLLIFNRLTWLTSQLQELLRALGLGDLVTLG